VGSEEKADKFQRILADVLVYNHDRYFRFAYCTKLGQNRVLDHLGESPNASDEKRFESLKKLLVCATQEMVEAAKRRLLFWTNLLLLNLEEEGFFYILFDT
jgi:hypothetical protein